VLPNATGDTVAGVSKYRPSHEALARRRAENFVATCTCGWIGREREDRRAATRDAREHEERAPIRELRSLAREPEEKVERP
jgi:hypothetical protein